MGEIRKTWTAEEVEKLKSMVQHGASSSACAVALNHSVKSVDNKRRELGIGVWQLQGKTRAKKQEKPTERTVTYGEMEDTVEAITKDPLTEQIKEALVNKLFRDETPARIDAIEAYLHKSWLYRLFHRFGG